MRILTLAALTVLSLGTHAIEYTPDADVSFTIIQMHDSTSWVKVCESSTGICDVPEGTYQVKLLDRNWRELVRLRDVSVQHSSSQDQSGRDDHQAPDLTAELCALYQVLHAQSLLGSLSVPTICSTVYSLGYTGSGGGFVFYLTHGGRHGLEAAPEDQVIAPWCAHAPATTGVTQTEIETGASNTDAILDRCPIAGNAAEVANGYTGGGLNDWFLPSKDELHTMYITIGQGCNTNSNPDCNVGEFYNSYWSSSEFSSTHAWAQDFDLDNQFYNNKLYKLSVRAIRDF
jgi:hypothetical protein